MQAVGVGPKTPSYVDCWPDRVVIYPGGIEVGVEQLQQPDNAFAELLNKVQANAASESIIVMVRPGSVKTYRMVRSAVGRRPIRVDYDVVDADFKIDWDEAIKAFGAEPERPGFATPSGAESGSVAGVPPAVARIEEPDLESAVRVENPRGLFAGLSSKRKQIRDFRASVVKTSGNREESLTVFYLADGELVRVDRRPDSQRGSTFYDGENYWEERGEALVKFPGGPGWHLQWLPDLQRLLSTNGAAVEVRETDRWVIIEQKTLPAAGPSFERIMQNPEFAKRMAEADAAVAEYARKHGLPAPKEDTRERLRRPEAERKPPVAQLERLWISKQNGLCYRREWREAESGRLLRRWKVVAIMTNIGLTPADFRPSTAGKQIIDFAHDNPAKIAEALTKERMKRLPERRMEPPAVPTTKAAVFFECRNDEVFYVDKDELDKQVAGALAGLSPGGRGGDVSEFLKAIQQREIGNEYYTVDPKFLLVGRMGLQPRAGVRGEQLGDLQRRDSKFHQRLAQLDKRARYICFLVRDDSFAVFRKARETAERAGFDTGWELLGNDEPIRFGESGLAVGGAN